MRSRRLLGAGGWPLKLTVSRPLTDVMKSLLLRLLLPAGAIVVGALAQLAFISAWPGVQQRSIAKVSLDSYLTVGAILILSFGAGRFLLARASERSKLLPSLVVPSAWILVLSCAAYRPPLSFSALSLVFLSVALAPLLGLLLAYSLPSNHSLERP